MVVKENEKQERELLREYFNEHPDIEKKYSYSLYAIHAGNERAKHRHLKRKLEIEEMILKGGENNDDI